MQIVVIEDEKLAAERLIGLITELEPVVIIAQQLDSVKTAIKWFQANSMPDLIFMDVQLADGLCFEIFEKIDINSPVIFTTAYNEYALRAFKVNSIDYLLKPIDKDELKSALAKYKKLNLPAPQNHTISPQIVKQVMEMLQNPYKQRFVVKIGEHIKAINTDDIAFLHSSEKNSFIRTITGRDFDIDISLDQIEQELDSQKFFRVSRKHIVALQHIKDIIAYSGNRYKLTTTGINNDEIIISREKVTAFKQWLDR